MEIKEAYQCEHCGQHYLRKISWLAHEQSCKKKEDDNSQCLRCAYMIKSSEIIYTNEGVKNKQNLFCDRLGYNLLTNSDKSEPADSIPMPIECPCFATN
jgi:hypothetical protein